MPVSSSQVVIGSIIGIGLYKGGKQIKYKILGSISLRWIATPIAAGVIAFFLLFFVNNVFRQDVGGDRIINSVELSLDNQIITDTNNVLIKGEIGESPNNAAGISEESDPEVFKGRQNNREIILWVANSLLIIMVLLFVYIYFSRRKKIKYLSYQIKALEEKYLLKVEHLEKSLHEKIHLQDDLGKELKFRQSEMVTMAMSIIHKNEFLNELKEEIIKIKANTKDQEIRLGLNKLSLMITQDLSIDRDREKFQMHINEQNSNFIHKLSEAYPSITDNEKRLASLLR